MTAGYAWADTLGDSASTLLHVLTSPAAHLAISYSSGLGLAKKDDRTIIESWDGQAWVLVLDTGFPVEGQGCARTLIPVPSGYLKNEGRYRIKVQARDTAEAVGESDWVEIDARYDGPAEPNIVLAEADPLRARFRLLVAQWPGSAQDFYGVELARESTDGTERLEVVGLYTDPTTTELVYHYPRSSVDYRIKARFVQVVGSERVESRWSAVIMNVNNSPYNFVKDADDPANLYAAFETEAADLATVEKEREKHVRMPWGAERPTIDRRWGGRIRTGTVVAQFYPDAVGQEDHEARYEKLYEITERDRCICVMLQVPRKAKYFASITGPVSEGWRPPRTHTIAFGWTENSFTEDVYEQVGLNPARAGGA